MLSTSCKIVAVEHLTLDGVFQSPARPDEDTRGNYTHGGWSVAGDDPEMNKAIGKYMSGGWSLLAGRTTYEDLYASWPQQQPDNPMTKALTDVEKFVVTQNASYTMKWENSTLLSGNAVDTVARLKEQHDKTLIVFGSGILLRSLMQADLVDEFVLMIHPIISGSGHKLFDSSTPFTHLKLPIQLTTNTGVLITTYKPA